MNNVRFENLRFDPDLTQFHDLAKQMAGAFGYTADLTIDRELAQLIRLRVSQRNQCSYCSILHSQVAYDIVLTEKLSNLVSYWEGDLYTDAEKAALSYCDALTDNDPIALPAAHDTLAQHYDARGIAELAAIIINMNVWTRLKLAQGAEPIGTQ